MDQNVAPPIERTTYVLLASAALVVMSCSGARSRSRSGPWAPGPAATGLLALSVDGWGVVLISTFLISRFELFGLTQVWRRVRGEVPERETGRHGLRGRSGPCATA